MNLPFVAQGYGAAVQKAAKQEMAYSDFRGAAGPLAAPRVHGADRW